MKTMKPNSIKHETATLTSTDLVTDSYTLTIEIARSGEYQFDFADDKQPALWFEASNAKFHLYLEGYFYLDSVNTFDPQISLDHFLHHLNTKSVSCVQGQIAGGLFNLFIKNKHTGAIEILNDRMGLLPLYILETDDQFIFSNNQFNFIHRSTLSTTACFEFLKYGYLPVSPSLFNQVERMGAGSRLFYIPQSTTIHRFPVLSFKSSSSSTINDTQWLDAFEQYFSKLKESQVMMGLSGGYDSRWIAASIRDLQPQLLNFGTAGCPETKLAKASADLMGLSMDNKQFPVDGINQYAAELRSKFRTISSLENVHVLHLSKCVEAKGANVYVDGFLGDVVVGDTYYREKPKRLREIFRFLAGKLQRSNPPVSLKEYAHNLYHQDKQGLDDAEITPFFGSHIAEELSSRYQTWIQENKQDFVDHFDQLEHFNLLTRGRNLIVNGPLAIQQHTQVLTPFMDYRILDLGINTPKDLKFAGKLYNALWRKKFPELSRLRKAGTYGKAADRPFMFRLKNLAFVLAKRVKRSWPQRTINQGEEHYFNTEDYLANEDTKKLVSGIMNEGNKHLPGTVQQKFRNAYANGEMSNTLLLRYISLLIYLGEER